MLDAAFCCRSVYVRRLMDIPSEGLDSAGFIGRLCRGIRERSLLCNTVAVLVLTLLDMN